MIEDRYVFRMTRAELDRAVVDGRVSERAERRYRLAWAWGAARFSGMEGDRQERFYAKHGGDALRARFARVMRAVRAVEEEARVANAYAAR